MVRDLGKRKVFMWMDFPAGTPRLGRTDSESLRSKGQWGLDSSRLDLPVGNAFGVRPWIILLRSLTR